MWDISSPLSHAVPMKHRVGKLLFDKVFRSFQYLSRERNWMKFSHRWEWIQELEVPNSSVNWPWSECITNFNRGRKWWKAKYAALQHKCYHRCISLVLFLSPSRPTSDTFLLLRALVLMMTEVAISNVTFFTSPRYCHKYRKKSIIIISSGVGCALWLHKN